MVAVAVVVAWRSSGSQVEYKNIILSHSRILPYAMGGIVVAVMVKWWWR